MSTIAKLRGSDFDAMVARGAFDSLQPLKIELVYGELRFINPAGPVHDSEIEILTNWSYAPYGAEPDFDPRSIRHQLR